MRMKVLLSVPRKLKKNKRNDYFMKKIILLIVTCMLFFDLNIVALANKSVNKYQQDGRVVCYYIPNSNFDAFYKLVEASDESPHDIAVIESEYSIKNMDEKM